MNLLERLGIPMDRLLPTRRVAEILGVAPATVLEWRKAGRLREAVGSRGTSYRFEPREVFLSDKAGQRDLLRKLGGVFLTKVLTLLVVELLHLSGMDLAKDAVIAHGVVAFGALNQLLGQTELVLVLFGLELFLEVGNLAEEGLLLVERVDFHHVFDLFGPGYRLGRLDPKNDALG